MSGRLAGWAETVALNGSETAIVAVRRGETPQLRFADFDGAEPRPMRRADIEDFAKMVRTLARNGFSFAFCVRLPGGAQRAAQLEPPWVEPMIDLLQRALKFSEGVEG